MAVQAIGWVGMVLALLAQCLVSNKKVMGDSFVFQLVSFLGAVGIGTNAWARQDWPVVALECFWAIIAIRIFSKKLAIRRAQ